MVNETINATLLNNPGVSEVSQNILNYFGTLPQEVMQGNIVAVIISLVLFFVAILLVNAISSLLLAFLKRSILFIIILLVIIDFFPRYMELVAFQGWTFSIIFIGIVAVIASGFALFIASRSFILSVKNHVLKFADKLRDKKDKSALEKKEEELITELKQKHQQDLHNVFTKESLKNEKSLLSVLVYLIVAQFGVFSSPTLSAPNTKVGIMFFSIFIFGILIFMKTSYPNLKTAAMYFGMTFLVGLILSFALGVLWGKNTLNELLSLSFFTSDSLVAMITGMGVSLFAGSKG